MSWIAFERRLDNLWQIVAASAIVFIGGFPMAVTAQSWQELSSHLFTNAAIDWQVSTSHLPESFWIYRRNLPRVFPATVISNAIVLGSLQDRGFPRPSTKDFYIFKREPPDWPTGIPSIFGMLPRAAYLYYVMPDCRPISKTGIPNDDVVAGLAVKYAPKLGLDPSKLTERKFYTHWCQTDDGATNFCGRGIFFPRHLDGIPFFSANDEGDGAEGYSMEFGEHGRIQAFSVRWSEIEHYRRELVASPVEIIGCLRAHKSIVLPNFVEGDFYRLRKLATAKKFTITKITLYYEEGLFGEMATNDVPSEFATPFAELEARAELYDTNIAVRILSPILSEDIKRVLKNKSR